MSCCGYEKADCEAERPVDQQASLGFVLTHVLKGAGPLNFLEHPPMLLVNAGMDAVNGLLGSLDVQQVDGALSTCGQMQQVSSPSQASHLLSTLLPLVAYCLLSSNV